MTTTTDKVRLGRNWVRVGDTVRVLPSRPRKKDGFDAELRQLFTDPASGAVTAFEVVDPVHGGLRVLALDRLARRHQNGAAVDRVATAKKQRSAMAAAVKPAPPRRGRRR